MLGSKYIKNCPLDLTVFQIREGAFFIKQIPTILFVQDFVSTRTMGLGKLHSAVCQAQF